jgi:hypothetical protein
MFYMPARYYEYIDVLHPKLQLVNGSPAAVTASASQPGLAGDLATLLAWNELDPVDEYEIHRNNLIYNNYQLNRNPFIDHPEWAEIAYDTTYSGSGASTAEGTSSVGVSNALVTSITLNTNSYTMNNGSTYALTASISPSNAGNKTLAWSSNNESVATVNNNGLVSAVSTGNATITAAATDGSGVSAACAITVVPAGTQVLEYITVSGASANATFHSTYSTSGIVVTAHYTDLTTEDVTALSTIDAPDTNILGEQTVSVTYEGKSTYYLVNVTNNGADVTYGVAGTKYESSTAAAGSISGWTNSGAGTAYADGSIKLDTTGDSIAKNDIWSGTSSQAISSIEITVSLKLNYSTGDKTLNEVSFYAMNGANLIASVKNTGALPTSPADLTMTINLNSPSTITGLKVEYTLKSAGNYGVYYVKATPTYELVHAELQADAWATYFLNETAEQCSTLEPQQASVWDNLASEYNWMHSDAKTYFTSAGSNANVQNAIARYQAIINAHPENEEFISGISSSNSVLPSLDKKRQNLIVLFVVMTATVFCGVMYIANERKKTAIK